MNPHISRSPSYLVRNSYSYCFRMKVPQELQLYFGKKELRYSLKTGYLGDAKFKARYLAGNIQQLFVYLMKGQTPLNSETKTKIQNIVSAHLKKAIADIDDRFLAIDEPRPLDDVESSINDIGILHTDVSIALGTCDYSSVKLIADRLLMENSVKLEKGSDAYNFLCMGILNNQKKELELERKRLLGEDVDIQAPVMRTEPIPSEAETVKLSEAIKRYVDENTKWKPKTVGEITTSLNLFQEFVGNVSIQAINRKKVGDFKRALMKFPSNMRKKKGYKDKTLDELLQMKIPKEDLMAPKTINKTLGRVGSLFNYAIKNGLYEGLNPATEMEIDDPVSDEDKRAPYDNEDLKKLFCSEAYVQDNHKQPFQFWMPILALFTGARQTELAQLYLSDIRNDDGVWVIDIDKINEGQKVKTNSGKRIVPIHDFVLKDLNFIGFVNDLKSKRKRRLFPEIKEHRDGYGARVSRWFNGSYKKKCGITNDGERKKDFHSFRTTFITRLNYKHVPKDTLKQVVGHSRGSDVTTKNYEEKFPVKQLYEEIISKIDYGIDLSHLKQSKYVIKKK